MNNELQNSINYIKDKAGDKPGFSIPKNYINDIEDDFFLKLKEEQLPKGNSFNIPDTYFDNLETKILNKVIQKKGKVISLKSRINKFIPIAAAASLLLFVGTVFFNNQNRNINLDDISYTDVENWFDETTTYTNSELAFTFEDVLDDNELTLTSITIENDALEDYFYSIDHADLINEIQ